MIKHSAKILQQMKRSPSIMDLKAAELSAVRGYTLRNSCSLFRMSLHQYLRTSLGHETAKGPFGFLIKLSLAHLSTTHGGGFTQSLFIAERRAVKL